MIVYGDIERVATAAATRASIEAALGEAGRLPPGLDRHAALTRAFLRTSELVQGLADAQFSQTGWDDVTTVEASGARLLRDMAEQVARSWTQSPVRLELLSDWRRRLDELDAPGLISMRQPEGFAHYALYPEAYFEAARRSGLGPQTVVIGIRSIGTSLSALVSATLGAAPAVTVRPTGHPFERRLALSPALQGILLARPDAAYAVVDEGPGLSGSSLNCVADWLETHGIATGRIHFFPGHAGDLGRHANPSHRRRWSCAPRHVVGFDEVPSLDRLRHWIADCVGPLDSPLLDISRGAWRRLRYAEERHWPPVDRQMEKRKFLARSRSRTWLIKFAGIGDIGTQKFAQANILADEGVVPEPLAFRHGFLVEPWIDAPPLDLRNLDRSSMLAQIARYLAARMRRLPASRPGAPVEALFAMAIQNTGECLGDAARDRIAGRLGDPTRLAPLIHPIATDNRMHAWEWLITPEGRLLKTDALDHCVGHDLVGCQDVTWDIAGAAVEFALTTDEHTFLTSEVALLADRPVEATLIEPMEYCYLAFQIGLWTDALVRCDGEDANRIRSTIGRYTTGLSALCS